MRKIIETALIIFGTLGWWGFVYPDLCLTEDVYEQEVQEEAASEDTGEKKLQGVNEENREGKQCASKRTEGNTATDGWRLGELRIKSRIVEYVYQVREKAAEGSDGES